MSGKRVRLTARRRSASDDIPYPGTVNQEDRQFVPFDEYDNFEQTINHELPDMRTEWRNDSRDEIGFPIAEEHTDVGVKDEGQIVAHATNVRQAAGKAVKLAMLLLGNKVAESLIEAQAKDFMKLGSAGLDRALVRFAKTESIYAKKAEEEVEEEVEAKKAGDKKDLPPEFLENIKKKEDGAEDKKDEKKESKKSAEEEVEEKVEAKKSSDDADEDDKVEAKKADEDSEVEEDEAPNAKKSSDDADEDDVTASELDIEMTASEDENPVEDEKSASILSALYEEVKKQGSKAPKADDDADEDDVAAKKSSDDADEDDAPKAKSASAKRGAQKLGGQPKVAGDMSIRDISQIWGETPDISGVFE